MIDLRLTMLSMIARHGTVTAAARALHYSPSTVSHQVKQLARELGVELLEQRGRYVRLTPAATALLKHVDVMAAEWEQALTDLDVYASAVAGLFVLCGFSTAASVLLPPTMRALSKEFPHLEAQAVEADPSECYDLLLSGDADLGLIVITSETPSRDDARFTQHSLIDDPLDLIVPQGHHLSEHPAASLADAAEETWIVARPGTTYHRLVMANCASAGFAPRVGHYASDWDTAMALVSNGFGVCVVSRLSRADNLHPVQRIPLTGEHTPTRHIAAIMKTGTQNRRTIRFCLDTLSREADSLMTRLGKEREHSTENTPTSNAV